MSLQNLAIAVASLGALGSPAASTPPLAPGPSGDLVALRVGRAETITQGTLEHAVILVENGKIVHIGEDLPIERGIPVIDLPQSVVTPGLVNCHTRVGMDGRAGRSFDPHLRAANELYARQDVWGELLEAGFTTLGLYPDGSGIPGQAVAVRPKGDTAADMILEEAAYLKINLVTSSASKDMLREAFEKVDEHDEKVAKAREKWEKDQEKKAKKKKSKKDDDEDKDEEKDEGPSYFVAPEADEKVVPFQALRRKELLALMSIRKASDYLHLLDVIEDEELDWSVHVPLRDDIDLHEIAERLGQDERRIVMTSRLTLQPSSRRERNLPAEFDRAGARVALVPESESLAAHEEWVHDVGRLVAAGLDPQAALAAMTLEPAHVLGLGDRLGSLEPGKTANLVLWDGDPFELSTRIQAVMLEGQFVTGEVPR